MADQQLQKDSLRMISAGMLLGIVNDVRPQGKFNFLQNVRSYLEGVIESRPRLDDFLSFAVSPNAVPHSMKTIINPNTSTFNRIVGAGTKLYSTTATTLAEKSSGFSGNPYFIVDFRPENSIEAYAYIADTNKFVKLSVSDTLDDVGISAPTKAATWQLAKPIRKIIDKIDTGSDSDWNHLTGSAGAPTVETRTNTTITAVVADGTLPNFVSIVPAAMTQDIQRGSIVTLNSAEDTVIEDIFPAALNASVATISSITYDSGSTGLCTIVLSIPSTDIQRDSILLLGGTEYVRVIDVTLDSNNIPSIRCSTTGTFAAAATVSGAASFRIYTANTYVAAQTIVTKAIKTVISASGISSITRTFNVDLTYADSKPLSLEDFLHFSILVSDASKITEIQIQLDVDTTTNDFTKNYFYYVISPNFLTNAALQTVSSLSVLQQADQRNDVINEHILRNKEVDPFGRDGLLIEDPTQTGMQVLQETSLGASQWTEVFIPLKDLANGRVGADTSRTFKDIKAVRISVNCTAAVDLYLDSIWVGGSNALDSVSEGFLPYNYVWRVRNPTTNVSSNWSPPLRTGIKLQRGKVTLTFPSANTDFSTSYKIDIARFGGSLNDFRLVGSIANDGSTYTDNSSDRLVADNKLAGRYEGQGATDAVFDFYKPFACLDAPKRGTCNVVGTKLTVTSTANLNVTYPRGTLITVNGIANKFYTNPSDTSHVELEYDMGALSSVTYEILSPLLTGKALPVIFGTFGDGNSPQYIYGLGDTLNSGTLYWLDGNSPDTMSDTNSLEISSPSEPLVAGVMYDGYAQVYSTQRSWTILPTQDALGRFSFMARLNANSRGVFSAYTIDSTPAYIYFLSENADGLYKVPGNGNPQRITSAGFDSLFYISGKAPANITLVDGTIIYPPDYTKPTDIRLFCTNDLLHFRFVDTNNQQVVLVIDCLTDNIISYDVYPSNQINAIYREETTSGVSILAGVNNAIKKFGTTGTFEDNIFSKVIPFALDSGDSNQEKEYKEVVTKVDKGTGGFTLRNYYDNGNSSDSIVTVAGEVSHTREKIITNLQDANGVGKTATNITTVYSWELDALVKLYEEIIYFALRADIITDRSSDLEYAGNIGEKLWQGVIIEADTFGADKILQYYDDTNTLQASITINHDGRKTLSYSFDQPFISHTIRRTSSDGIEWMTINEVYVTDSEPESAKVWEGEFNLSGLTGLILAKRCAPAYRSTAVATITFIYPDGTEEEYDLPSSNGDWHKEEFYLIAKKFESCKYRIESTEDIRVYKEHSELWAKSINSQQDFICLKPFGGPSNVTEITI